MPPLPPDGSDPELDALLGAVNARTAALSLEGRQVTIGIYLALPLPPHGHAWPVLQASVRGATDTGPPD